MKVSIIGVGHVGSSVGMAVVAQGLADEVVLVGRRPEVAAGEALDLTHASAFGPRPAEVRAGAVADTAGSDVVVLCVAGRPAEGTVDAAGDARHRGARANAALVRQLVPPLAAASPSAVLVMTTNPLDAMTTLAADISGLPPAQVLGTGTLLDTMRLRVLLSRHCDIHPHDIRAYVLGEHGETQFAALSSASTGGAKLPVEADVLQRMVADTRRAGHDIYAAKGHTNHGVAMSAATVVRAVAGDTREVMPVCTRVDDLYGVAGVCLSVPAVIGRGGVQRVMHVELTEAEQAAFRHSAEAVRRTLLDEMG